MDKLCPWTEVDVLRKLQAEAGLTMSRWARESGVSHKTITRLVNGETEEPKQKTLAALARVFGVSLDDLRAAVPKQSTVRLRVADAVVVQWRQEHRRSRRPRIAMLACALVCVAVLIACDDPLPPRVATATSAPQPNETGTPGGAYAICQEFVRGQLKTPATATFPRESPNDITASADRLTFTVKTYVGPRHGPSGVA